MATAAARTVETADQVLTWSKGYRIEHWTRVLSMSLLIATGLYIHWPIGGGSTLGSDGTMMATMRLIHFSAAYVLILGLVLRVYMAFNSKFDADWRDFGIIRNLKNAPAEIGYYLFLKKEPPAYRKYNPLQALNFLFWAFLIVVQSLIGFSLYGGKAFGVMEPGSFTWVLGMFGGEAMARNIHVLIMWFFMVTVVVHIYASLVTTYWRKDDTIRSIVTGYKKKH